MSGNTRLADLRTTITDLDKARDTMREIALIEKRLAIAKARYEKRVADVLAMYQQEIEGRRLAQVKLVEDLTRFIESNKQLFQDPRTVKTEFGAFGLRQVMDLVVTSEADALADVMNKGYDDCFEIKQSLVKPAIAKRIQDKETILGCQIRSGDVVVCKVAKAVVEEGLKQLEE